VSTSRSSSLVLVLLIPLDHTVRTGTVSGTVCTERITIFLHYSPLSVVFSFTRGIRGSLKLIGTRKSIYLTKG
jgi:hypothetical protein